jgi:hypoxanthine phosphoribosyltransferase
VSESAVREYSFHEDILSVLYSEDQIQARVRELGHQLAQDYAEKQPIVVGVLRGVVFFMADLVRRMPIPLEMDFMAITSYGRVTRPTGTVMILKDLDETIEGRHVLLVEDIVDTGLTLSYILRVLGTRNPASLEVCTLLNRSVRRLIDIPIRYIGFDIPDVFVVGYGLDYLQRYRNLPYIGILKPEITGWEA